MTREHCMESQKAFNHFASGGSLWYYNKIHKEWYLQKNLMTVTTKGVIEITNIIEDKHFQARKAYALGGKVEHRVTQAGWVLDTSPEWFANYEYRVKHKEPVYEWLYICHYADDHYSCAGYATEEEANLHASWIKFDLSKRCRKDKA